MQLSLLPASGQKVPEGRMRGSLDLAALSFPARTFTGDFYFAHRTGNVQWLIIGDVAGKGLSAAVIMAMLQEEIEHRTRSIACDPAVIIRRLHELMLPLHPGNRFASIVVARIHDNGAVKVANAGHPPPLIARVGGRIETIGSTGPVAGLLQHSTWTSVHHYLAAGETLLLYTDGAIEANDFGVDGISAALRFASNLPTSRAVAEAVAAAVRRHGEVDDDLTLLIARR